MTPRKPAPPIAETWAANNVLVLRVRCVSLEDRAEARVSEKRDSYESALRYAARMRATL